MNPTLSLRVRSMTWEADGVLSVELVPAQTDTLLPAAEPGAHVDLHLAPGLVRSYSLTNPGERHRWCIAVNLDAASRGGSRFVHAQLRPGQVVAVDGPRNHFALDEGAGTTVLIAGGIGITPILSMARRLSQLGKPWTLHYAARTRAQMAFADALQALAASTPGAVLDLACDHEPGGRMLDLPAIVGALPADAHVYCCGPAPMLAAFEAACRGLAPARVHLEHFKPTQEAATAGGFDVKLARSGRVVPIAAGQTILDALLDAGVDALYSCREGICGTCETRVLSGTPEHRDMVLSDDEMARGDRMMICCSGSRGPMLELDL